MGGGLSNDDPNAARIRRAALLAGKLKALAGEHGADARSAGAFPPGAALLADGCAWVLLDTDVDDGVGLGPAIVWATRRDAVELHVVADVALTVIARRGTGFDLLIHVWAAKGRELHPVEPGPLPPPPPPAAEHLGLVDEIEAAGATPNIEHGVVTGEVRGLEVCRVVDVTAADGRPSVRLEVGVGVHDRDAFATVHGDVPTPAALAGVVATVAAARSGDGRTHPLGRLAPERLLRWRLQQEPWLVGMASVTPTAPPVPRRSLRQQVPCTAIGRRLDGTDAVLVCSVGVDLDVVPYAIDARLAAGGSSGAGVGEPPGDGGSAVETSIVLPGRDVLPVQAELAGRLRHSVSLVGLPSG